MLELFLFFFIALLLACYCRVFRFFDFRGNLV